MRQLEFQNVSIFQQQVLLGEAMLVLPCFTMLSNKPGWGCYQTIDGFIYNERHMAVNSS